MSTYTQSYFAEMITAHNPSALGNPKMPPSDMLYDDCADDWDWERQALSGIDTPCDLMALIVLDDFSNYVGNICSLDEGEDDCD